jgi:uncharacterized repeat protein (TIGR01451 family)
MLALSPAGAAAADVPTRVVALEQVLMAADGAPGDQFGHAVAMDGDRVVAGSPRDRIGTNSTQGSAYVFVRVGGAWSQEAKLIAADGQAEDKLGNAVAIIGDTAVIGAATATVGPDLSRGAVYVFTRAGNVWSQQARLLAADGAAGHRFGYSVAVNGDTIVVGAPGVNVNQGAAYVFVRSNGQWSQQAKLVAGDGASGHQLGFAVGVSGDVAVAGATGVDQSRGAVYSFTRGGVVWTPEQKIVSADRQPGDRLGFSVAVDQDTVAAGAIDDSTGAMPHHGSAYVFVRQAAAWVEQQKLVAGDAAASDGLGGSIALQGDRVVVGVQPDGPLPQRFSAYVFERAGGSWAQQQKLTSGGAEDGFGRSVGTGGGRVVAGAPFAGAGLAYVYSGATPNTAPMIAAAGPLEREQGAAPAASVVAAVSDAEDAPGTLAVTGLAPAGITLSALSNSDGTITALVGAECAAPVGAAPVPLTVTDSGGLTATDTLLVHVVANTVPPSITCGPDVAAIAAPGNCTAIVGYTLPLAADDCPGVTVACAPPPGSVFASGATPVACTAFDASGNTAGCQFMVTVTPNLVIAPPGQSFPGGGGTGTVAVTAAAGCAWTAASNDAWITVTSGPGGSGTGTVTYTVAPQTMSTPRTGTVAIAGRTFTVTQDGVVPALADLEVVFGAASNTVNVGSALTYTLTVTNHGPTPAIGVQVEHQMPGGLRFTGATATQGTAATAGAGELRWQVGALSVGASAVLTVAGEAAGPGAHFASASVTSAVADPEAGNDRATFVWIFVRRPPTDLAITSLTASPSPAVVGRPLTYTIGIVNHGPSRAKQVELHTLIRPENGQPLPDVTYVTASSTRGGTFTHAPDTFLRYELDELQAGEADTLTVVVIPTALVLPARLENAARLSTAPYFEPETEQSSDPDSDRANNQASAATIVLPATGTDVAITRVSASASPVVVGTRVSYTIEAVNHGPDTALATRFVFGLAPMERARPVVLGGVASQGGCVTNRSELRCALGDIPAGGAVSVVASVDTGRREVNETDDLVGHADISVGSAPTEDTDPYPTNNRGQARVVVTPASGYNLAVASLSATPVVVAAGAPVVYTMEVVNAGPDPAADAYLLTLVTLADAHRQLGFANPGDLALVSATSTQGTCEDLGDRGLLCALGPLDAGASATVTVTAVPVPNRDITMYAVVFNSLGPDPDLDRSDNLRSVTTHSLQPPGIDLAITRFEVVPFEFDEGWLLYRLDVVNRGPTATSGFPIVVRLPGDPQGFRVIASEFPVEERGQSVTEAFTGTFLSGQTTTLIFAASFEAGTADVVSHAAVSCAFVETNPADNTAVAVTPRAKRRAVAAGNPIRASTAANLGSPRARATDAREERLLLDDRLAVQVARQRHLEQLQHRR